MSNPKPKITAAMGIDIGGTNIKIVLVDPRKGKVIDQVDLKTFAQTGAHAIVRELGATLAKMTNKAKDARIQVEVVGVGCAGVIDLQKGSVSVSPNLPGWEEFPLQEKLCQMLDILLIVSAMLNTTWAEVVNWEIFSVLPLGLELVDPLYLGGEFGTKEALPPAK